MEKTEFLNEFYASDFHSKRSRHPAQVMKGKCKDCESEEPKPTVGGNQVQDHLRNQNVHKSMGSDEIHPWVLRVDKVTKLLSTIFEKLGQSGEILDDSVLIWHSLVFGSG